MNDFFIDLNMSAFVLEHHFIRYAIDFLYFYLDQQPNKIVLPRKNLCIAEKISTLDKGLYDIICPVQWQQRGQHIFFLSQEDIKKLPSYGSFPYNGSFALRNNSYDICKTRGTFLKDAASLGFIIKASEESFKLMLAMEEREREQKENFIKGTESMRHFLYRMGMVVEK